MKARKILKRNNIFIVTQFQKGAVYRSFSYEGEVFNEDDFWFNSFVWLTEENIHLGKAGFIKKGSLLAINKDTLYVNTKFDSDFKFREIENGKKIIAKFCRNQEIEFIKNS